MPYALGIDLGSGHLTAAICRNDRERWSEPEVLALDGTPVTEAVLHLTDEGTVEVGDRALRHVTTRPDRVTRGFVDRVGDEIPITLGGQPYPAEVLIAAVVGWIADYAEASEGMPASQIVVTHPASWGTHRRGTLLGAIREAGLGEVTLLPRPVAAAESYAAAEQVEVGQEIAVHSLGAGRFESAVLRRGSFGFELRAHADGAEQAGGDLFDDLLAARVLADLGHEVEPVALAKLRVACRTAKERLSTELAVTVPAPAKSPRGTVMVNRTDLEELIRPALETTVAALKRTIQAAGTSTGTLRAVVLVGGCGRIPLVSELVSAGVRVRVAAAPDPELSVARGAALAAARVAKPTVKAPALAQPVAAVAHTDLMRFDDLPAEEEVVDIGPPPPRPPVEITPLEPPKRRLSLRLGRTRDDDDDDVEDEVRPARRRTHASDLSGADLFTPLADASSPELFTHSGDSPRDGGEWEGRANPRAERRGTDLDAELHTEGRPALRADLHTDSRTGLRRDRRDRAAEEDQAERWPNAAEDRHDLYPDDRDAGRPALRPERRRTRTEHRRDLHAERQHSALSENRHPETLHSARTEDPHAERLHSGHTENRHPETLHGGHAEDPHAERLHGGHAEDRHADRRQSARAATRHDLHAESLYSAQAGNGRELHAERQHGARAATRHDLHAGDRHDARQARRDDAREPLRTGRHEVVDEPRRRESRHDATPESRGGRRHRTDDRAFNESLSRARHATRTADGDYEDLR